MKGVSRWFDNKGKVEWISACRASCSATNGRYKNWWDHFLEEEVCCFLATAYNGDFPGVSAKNKE